MGQQHSTPAQQVTPDVGTDQEGGAQNRGSNSAVQDQMNAGGEFDQAKAQLFLNKCSEANTIIDGSYAAAESCAYSVAVSYKTAWDLHKNALDAASARQKLVADLILAAAFTFAAGFAGPYIAPLMAGLSTNKHIVDATTDLVKWGISTAGTSISPPSPRPLQAFPTDPNQWQNLVNARMSSEKAGVYAILQWWQSRANAQDTALNLNFDPRTAIRSLLSLQNVPLNNMATVDIGVHAVAFEKGFWAKWCELYGFGLTVGMFGVFYAGETVPKEGEERLVALLGSESAAEAFILQHGASAKEQAEEEAGELNRMPRPVMMPY
jgi:hypothetical protein